MHCVDSQNLSHHRYLINTNRLSADLEEQRCINLTPSYKVEVSFVAYSFFDKATHAGTCGAGEVCWGEPGRLRADPFPDTTAHFDEGSNGRRRWIPDELQTPELQILLLNLVNGDSLITFSGNFLGSSFSGGYLSTQFLG